nr:hypothetical protein [Candidatus Enterovibrio escacola]
MLLPHNEFPELVSYTRMLKLMQAYARYSGSALLLPHSLLGKADSDYLR